MSEQNQKKDLQDLEKIKQIQAASKPMFLTKAFVEKPCHVIAVISVIFAICTILTFSQNLFEQTQSEDREWSVWSDQITIDNDIWDEVRNIYKKKSENQAIAERSEEIDNWNTYLVLECYEDESECENALTSEYVTALYQLEQKIKTHPDFSKYCLATSDSTECTEEGLISFTKAFSDAELADGLISEDELQTKLNEILTDDDLYTQYSYLFAKEFKTGNPKSSLLLSIFKFGAPLMIDGKLYKNRYDDFDKQEDEFVEFSRDILDLVDDEEEKQGDKVNFLILSGPVADILFAELINGDFLWALASIIFVWGYLTFHLKSFFLSSFSMLAIIMSFMITSVIFKLILQITYFSTLHILVIFIVLGIAADDIFVYIDAWKQTEFYETLQGDFNKRMAVTFRRASKAMLATSSTTSAAFLATGFSSIMPISSFGIYAAILVPMNYILTITWFPALLIFFEKNLKHKTCCCTKNDNKYGQKNQQLQQQNQQSVGAGAVANIPITQNQDAIKVTNYYDDQQVNQNKQQQIPQQEQKSVTKVELFFENQFNTFVYKGRYIIIAITLIWFGIATYLALQLGPQTKPDQWLPDSYKLQRIINHLQQDFHQTGESEYGIFVNLLWGADGMNTDDNGLWDQKDVGEVIWDTKFDLSPETNQLALHTFCENLKSNESVRDGKIECFMLDFKTWLISNSQAFPVPQSQFLSKLEEFLETPEGYGYYIDNRIGIFDGKLNYVSVRVISVGDPIDNYEKKQPIYDDWEKIESDFNKSAPVGVNNMMQSSDDWTWMVSQKAFVDQAIGGMLISIAFALLVLLLSTHNFIVSLYSIFSITGIVVSVTSIMYMSGWELGVAESITIVILIGFSVDYVVHLAQHYVESSYADKYSRTQESLKEIGISIISGAITTLGSGIFLFLAVVSIFNKFAVLIVATILFALAFSLIFFSALMHTIGPQNNQGNLLMLCKKKSEKVGSETSHRQQKQGDIENPK